MFQKFYNRETCVGSKGISASYILPVDGSVGIINQLLFVYNNNIIYHVWWPLNRKGRGVWWFGNYEYVITIAQSEYRHVFNEASSHEYSILVNSRVENTGSLLEGK